MTQGETIREARTAARMTQEHLAKSAGVSEKTVRRAERSERISAENVRALCACLGLDAATLPQPDEPECSVPPPDQPDATGNAPVPEPPATTEASTVPSERPVLSRVKTGPSQPKPIEAFLVSAILSVFLTSVVVAYQGGARKDEYLREVDRVGKDPAYLERAGKAGYRVDVEGNSTDRVIVARCVRSDASGPLPCDPVPKPEGKVGDGMIVLPGDRAPPPKGDSGTGYLCPGIC